MMVILGAMMATDQHTIAVYVKSLRGKILVIHGTSVKESTVAKQLEEQLTGLGTRETECLPVSVKELSHAVGKAGHVVLIFNSLDNFTRKLRHNDEFVTQVMRMRQSDLAVVCRGSQIPSNSPLIHFMRFGFDEDAHHLAVKCATVFGGNTVTSDAYILVH